MSPATLDPGVRRETVMFCRSPVLHRHAEHVSASSKCGWSGGALRRCDPHHFRASATSARTLARMMDRAEAQRREGIAVGAYRDVTARCWRVVVPTTLDPGLRRETAARRAPIPYRHAELVSASSRRCGGGGALRVMRDAPSPCLRVLCANLGDDDVRAEAQRRGGVPHGLCRAARVRFDGQGSPRRLWIPAFAGKRVVFCRNPVLLRHAEFVSASSRCCGGGGALRMMRSAPSPRQPWLGRWFARRRGGAEGVPHGLCRAVCVRNCRRACPQRLWIPAFAGKG